MFAPPICRRSRRNASKNPSYISATVVSLDSTKTAAPGEHRSERSEPSDRASLASEAIKLVRAGD